MDEQELRTIVRAAIARHTGTGELPTARPPVPGARPAPTSGEWRGHASHILYASLVNTSEACLIEPAVPCNHCNYCKSHGH